tara:strand:+ start:170 stop:670 length:501 start_codon:yes stop_codon:yes gene_type:complete
MPIFLIGYMGSGKSTIGKCLSKVMNLPFVDLDNLIESEMEMSITQIFNEKGELFFRQKEHDVLSNYPFKLNTLVATGGGTPCFFNNLNLMNLIGHTIYLEISNNELFKRLESDKKRPLLCDKKLPLKGFINKQINTRKKYYQMSNYVLKSDNISINEVQKLVNKII